MKLFEVGQTAYLCRCKNQKNYNKKVTITHPYKWYWVTHPNGKVIGWRQVYGVTSTRGIVYYVTTGQLKKTKRDRRYEH